MIGIWSVLARGGASRGLIIHQADIRHLQPDTIETTFARLVGSPDPGSRQVDGVGGGTATTSKVVVIAPIDGFAGEVSYDFYQIDVASGTVDRRGTCGNLTAAAAQFAVTEGLVAAVEPVTRVLLRSVNTGRSITADVPVVGGAVSESEPIEICFLQPSGGVTGKLFPAGLAQRSYHLDGLDVAVTLIDVVNPVALIDATSINVDPCIAAEELDQNPALLSLLERVRRHAAYDFGLQRTAIANEEPLGSLPFVGVCGPPRDYRANGGTAIPSKDYSLSVRLLSSGTAHRAVPLGAALACAAAARIPGTVAHHHSISMTNVVQLGHPSGLLEVQVRLSAADESVLVESVSVSMTARRIMEGTAFA